MAKTNTNSANNTVQVILLVALALLVGYLLAMGKTYKKDKVMSPSETSETITSPSDMDKTQDDVDAVNLDAIDSGLNQLNNEVRSY